jgi:hypothetical protein
MLKIASALKIEPSELIKGLKIDLENDIWFSVLEVENTINPDFALGFLIKTSSHEVNVID